MSLSTQYPESVDDFNRVTGELRSAVGFREPLLFAIGRRVFTKNSVLASVRYPVLNGPGKNLGTAAILMKVLGIEPEGVQNVSLTRGQVCEALKYFAPFMNDGKPHGNIDVLSRALYSRLFPVDEMEISKDFVATFIFNDIAPVGVEDSTLKLYGMSTRHFKPNTLNLDKIFTKLPNVAWQGDVPMDEMDVERARMESAFGEELFAPDRVDKFPLYAHRMDTQKMGVRIGDASKVRLGAYLGEGTTVMAGTGFINYGAGTEGESMVEGRISSSAFVGDGTAVGGGASILGTLSGGNSVPIIIGRKCLLEANSVTGIPLGDACIVAAGDAVLASTLVVVNVENHPKYRLAIKAGELAGINAVTFRRHSLSGQMEVVRTHRNINFANKLKNGESILNADLHQNN